MPLDLQVKALLDFIGITTMPPLETLTVEEARARSAAFAEMRRQMATEPVDSVRDVMATGPAGEIPIRIYAPKSSGPSPALIYLHGGGWVLGDLDGYDPLCRSLANSVPCTVLSVDYRLGPENKFPAAVHDSYAALEWIAAHAGELGIDPSRIAVGGDSAGGNLSAVISQMTRDRRGPKIAFQLLIYPATDMRMSSASIEENADGPILTKAGIIWFMNHYLNGPEDRTNPWASPLLANDLAGLPPAFILTAECDPLRDEGEAYGRKLQAAGGHAEILEYKGMPHGFFSFAAALEGGRRAMADSADRLRSALGIAHSTTVASS
jgi:acetyl esterase